MAKPKEDVNPKEEPTKNKRVIRKIVYREASSSYSEKKWCRSCDRNSNFFCDLILMKVSELNGIVRFIFFISL
jgi:hypothetical protein